MTDTRMIVTGEITHTMDGVDLGAWVAAGWLPPRFRRPGVSRFRACSRIRTQCRFRSSGGEGAKFLRAPRRFDALQDRLGAMRARAKR